MPGIPEADESRAHALAKDLAIRSRDGGFVPDEARETVNQRFERWQEARSAEGPRHAGRRVLTDLANVILVIYDGY